MCYKKNDYVLHKTTMCYTVSRSKASHKANMTYALQNSAAGFRAMGKKNTLTFAEYNLQLRRFMCEGAMQPCDGATGGGVPQPCVQTADDPFFFGNLDNLGNLADLDTLDDLRGIEIGDFFSPNDHDQATMIPADQATIIPTCQATMIPTDQATIIPTCQATTIPVVQATTIPVVQPIYTDAAHELAPAKTTRMSGIRFVAGSVMDTIKGGKTSLYGQLKNARGHTFLTKAAMMELASEYEIVLMQEQKLTHEELTFLEDQPLKKIVWMGAPIGETFFKVYLNNWFDSKSNKICRRG